jgi:hypothetical protein
MRRLLYAVAAVVALAPLAAIGPASAAVQHRAAAQAETCTGGWPVIIGEEFNSATPPDPIGYLFEGAGDVMYSETASPSDFCLVTLTSAYAFRVKGTSDCMVYTPSTGVVSAKACDYGSANQQWRGIAFNELDGWSVASATSKCLDGSTDSPVYMTTCNATGNQFWDAFEQ